MLDENKWLAARHGLAGELVDLPSAERVPAKTLAKRLVDRLREHAQDLGSAAELDGIEDLLEQRQRRHRQTVVYEANHDLREVMAEIVAATAAVAASIAARALEQSAQVSTEPDLFVICKSCSSEVSPYITECPYCGARLRKRAPKIERSGAVKRPRGAKAAPQLPRLRPRCRRSGCDETRRPVRHAGVLGHLAVLHRCWSRRRRAAPAGVVLAPVGRPWHLLTRSSPMATAGTSWSRWGAVGGLRLAA